MITSIHICFPKCRVVAGISHGKDSIGRWLVHGVGVGVGVVGVDVDVGCCW